MNTRPPKVYLDSNVFIAAYETVGAHGEHAQWILSAVERGDLVAVTSEITLSEVLVKPLEFGDATLSEAYQAMLGSTSSFEVVACDRSLLIAAAQLRAQRRGLKLPDALHLATAVARGCAHFVTNDTHIPMPGALRHHQVSPFTVDDITRGD